MVLTLTVASKEVEDFVLKVKIDADATFADLNQVIRDACGCPPLSMCATTAGAHTLSFLK